MSTFSVTQEGPVNALALNKDNTQVAIGGRNVFKVYAIEDNKFREICNLRASKHLNLSFSCNDVSWSWTDDHYLATAATNGHVCVWNLTKMGKAMQEQDYQDHKRTVNKVNFHATEPNRLISGSQDGTMRYFDIRIKSAVSVFYSNTESVRDVQFSPHNPCSFAAVSDNGSVQLWDVRRPDKFQQAFTAHSGPVFACDWHPENYWLATASRDKTIKVWDLTLKPTLEYTIHTIASIGHVKWRPQRKYHIASCALVIDCSINIWDIRRPYIPFASFNDHRDIASGVAWRGDPHIFLSSGRDCTLFQHLFNDASRPASKANPHGVSINNKEEVLSSQKINILANNVSTPNNSIAKATVGLMRKISNTQPIDQFHQASSTLHNYSRINQFLKKHDNFIGLAKNYKLAGHNMSELCEHNANVARQYGKPHVSTVWKIIKTLYGEGFVLRGTIPSGNNNINDIPIMSSKESQQPSSPICDNEKSHFKDEYEKDIHFSFQDNDQKSVLTLGGAETPGAQFSGGDDETEMEDQLDGAAYNGFPSYLNYRSGLPKGDFSFGENELDMEIDGYLPGGVFRNGYSNFHSDTDINKNNSDWILPSEAFPIRHEILDRSPPPESFQNKQPDIKEESRLSSVHLVASDEYERPGTVSVSHPLRKPVWDPSNILVEALKHHATQGDIQTTASILLVMGDARKFLKLNESFQEYWLYGYIELLSQYQLYNIATQVIKLSWIPSVLQLNQLSTRINTNCSKCTKPLQRIGWLCDRCHTSSYGLCAVCHQVVKGMYVWCQGCSHGGHLTHVQQFLKDKKTCPAGCGHKCNI